MQIVNKKAVESAHMSVCLVIRVWIVYLGTQGARTTRTKGQEASVHTLFELYAYYDEFPWVQTGNMWY